MNNKNYADFKMMAIDAKEVVEEVFMLFNLKEEIIKYYQDFPNIYVTFPICFTSPSSFYAGASTVQCPTYVSIFH